MKIPSAENPRAEMSPCRNVHVPKSPHAEKSLCRNAHMPKSPRAEMRRCQKNPVPKRARVGMFRCRKVPVPKSPRAEKAPCRNVPVLKCPSAETSAAPNGARAGMFPWWKICAEMTLAEMSRAEKVYRPKLGYSGDFFCMPQDEQSTNLFPIKFRKRCKIVIIISHAIFSQQYDAKPHMEFYLAHLYPEYIY